MKLRKDIMAVAILTPVLFLSAHALAAGGDQGCMHERAERHGGGMFDRPQCMEKMFRKLDVQPEQQERIKQVIASKQDTRQALMEKLSETRKQMQALRGQGYEPEKFNQLARQHADSKVALMVFNYELRHALKNELTAEQQAQLEAQMEERMAKRKEHRQEKFRRMYREG